MTKFYLAETCDQYGAEMAQKNGIAPDHSGIITLASETDAAVLKLLHEAYDAGNDPEKIKIVYVFEIELPALAQTGKLEPEEEDLQKYSFVTYKGSIEPEFIKDCFIVDLFGGGRGKDGPVYNTSTIYFATLEDEAEDVEKNGYTIPDAIPDGDNLTDGVILATTIEETVALYAELYHTKENGIKSLAVFGVKFPPYVKLESDADVKLYEDAPPVRTFTYKGKIPPEYITGHCITDLKPGGLFA